MPIQIVPQVFERAQKVRGVEYFLQTVQNEGYSKFQGFGRQIKEVSHAPENSHRTSEASDGRVEVLSETLILLTWLIGYLVILVG